MGVVQRVMPTAVSEMRLAACQAQSRRELRTDEHQRPSWYAEKCSIVEHALPPSSLVAEVKKPTGPQKFSKRQVQGRLRQLKRLYDEWLLTEEFYAKKVAECEAAL